MVTLCSTLLQNDSTWSIRRNNVRVHEGKAPSPTSNVLWALHNAVSTAIRDSECIGRKKFQKRGEQVPYTCEQYLIQANCNAEISMGLSGARAAQRCKTLMLVRKVLPKKPALHRRAISTKFGTGSGVTMSGAGSGAPSMSGAGSGASMSGAASGASMMSGAGSVGVSMMSGAMSGPGADCVCNADSCCCCRLKMLTQRVGSLAALHMFFS